eukprot:8643355-Karenia_brevis.AAC.1
MQYKNGKVSGKRRAFGIDPADGPIALHNVFYHVKADGTEAVSVFANWVGSDSYSHAFDFDLKIVDEQQKAAADDD